VTAGDFKMFQGQRYECISTRPYVRRDGVEVTLGSWRSHCATCGLPFEFELTVEAWDREGFRGTIRRCKQHRRPGLKVVHEAIGAGKLRILKMTMADAHPDKGGSSEDFIKARAAYVEAKQRLAVTKDRA
jgi:hypothetical protein